MNLNYIYVIQNKMPAVNLQKSCLQKNKTDKHIKEKKYELYWKYIYLSF